MQPSKAESNSMGRVGGQGQPLWSVLNLGDKKIGLEGMTCVKKYYSNCPLPKLSVPYNFFLTLFAHHILRVARQGVSIQITTPTNEQRCFRHQSAPSMCVFCSERKEQGTEQTWNQRISPPVLSQKQFLTLQNHLMWLWMITCSFCCSSPHAASATTPLHQEAFPPSRVKQF